MPTENARQVAIEAKHLRPRFDRVSLRPDARDAFAAALARRLTVVCAPAGYGKTTTTAAALEQCGCTAAWYKLDILDHDPLAFLAAMTRAVQRLNPGFGTELLRELESGPVVDIPAELLAARFCSECDQFLTSDHHLVLDDYHEAMDSAALNNVLGYLLENCPATIHFVALTRYEPAFRLEKLRLAGEVSRLPRDLFLFDGGQVAEVLARWSGREHDPAHVRRLLELTEGWPASVVLAGMALTWLDVSSLEEALGDPRLRADVFSYLAEQVFQRQAEDVQLFLLTTCCLEHITAELAELLTGAGGASRHLHFLARNHIFTFDTERAGAYRYHNLLRDFLRQRFVQDEGETAFRALQRHTAAALEECGDRPSAVELLLGANELDLALQVIARGGEAELERRPSEQLRIWVGRLAPSMEAGQPWARIAAGVLDAREGRFGTALANLNLAAEQLQLKADRPGLYEALSITEWAEFWSGDSAASMSTSYRALELASTEAQRLHTLLSLLSAGVDMRRWRAVESASAKVEELLPRAKAEEICRAQALRAHAAFYQGDMRIARQLLEACQDQEQSVAQQAASLNTLGMIDTALGEYASAARHLEDASRIASGFGRSLESHIEDSIAFLEGAVGRFDTALVQLRWLQETSGSLDPTMLCSVLMHQGTMMRRAGDIQGAMPAAQEALEKVDRDRDPYLTHNSRANVALTKGLLGADQQAELLLISSHAASAGLVFVELKARMFAGILADLAGDAVGAVELLEECLPRQLALGHINLVAQELCPRPELAGRIIRRHSKNGLGPVLLDALHRHWLFPDAIATLREFGTAQVTTWLGHIADRSPSEGHAEAGRELPSGHPRPPFDHTSAFGDLTLREREVLELMAQDRSNDEIARELFIALSTVKTHVNHILRKLGQTKRVGAVLEYQRLSGDGATPDAHRRA